MVESSVPVHHEEDHQSQSEIHNKKDDTACAVFSEFIHRLFSCIMLACIAHKEKAHQSKGDIVNRKRKEPKRAVAESHSQLKKGICGIHYQRNVKGSVHPQSCVIMPNLCVLVFVFKCSEKSRSNAEF